MENNVENVFSIIEEADEQRLMAYLNENKDVDINIKNENGQTPIYYACQYDMPSLLKILINKGGDSNIAEPSGFTPLHLCAHLGLENSVKFLIEEGKADVNKPNGQGATALHLSASQNHTTVVDILIKGKANLLLKDEKGKTAIQYAEANSDSFNLIKSGLLKMKEERSLESLGGEKNTINTPPLSKKNLELEEKVQKALKILQEKLVKEKELTEKLRKSLNIATICQNCHTKKKDTLIFPCLHVSCCSSCSQSLETCISCNQSIEGKVIINN
eukprot:TRINITY_DN14136_c0_g1_i1.p1 TRINITY_DN14136_c0_g1~~TRINITY_DN14136_c0_g1_i1.p1  ORF type:complete len:273 (-),score=70.58 TRINITY_DN14136_c0_g1_i1:706-1524(-)